jgi:hypothetical protein
MADHFSALAFFATLDATMSPLHSDVKAKGIGLTQAASELTGRTNKY